MVIFEPCLHAPLEYVCASRIDGLTAHPFTTDIVMLGSEQLVLPWPGLVFPFQTLVFRALKLQQQYIINSSDKYHKYLR